MPARDADGCLRILDAGLMPFPADVLEVHESRLRQRADRDGVPYNDELAVASVFELSEPLSKLISDKWTLPTA
jgi:methylaspartate mutase epsilon subunit